MNRRSIWIGTIAWLAAAHLAVAADTELKAATTEEGKTVVIESGNPFGGSGGGASQPGRSFRMNFHPSTAKLEKGSYLGITASPVTGALRSQLKLQPGVGLVVENVEKNSPAATAGVERYDILQQFNEQILIDTRQFGVLVRLAKPGDEVTLKVLRKGETESIKATLVEKELPPLDADAGFLKSLTGLDGLEDRIAFTQTEEPFNRAMEYFRKNRDATGQFSYSDKGLTLNITQQGGKRHLVAKDEKGKVVFDGPIDTEEQRNLLPPEIAKKLKEVYAPPTPPAPPTAPAPPKAEK